MQLRRRNQTASRSLVSRRRRRPSKRRGLRLQALERRALLAGDIMLTVAPSSISESGGAAFGSVTLLNGPLASDLDVTLSSSDTGEAFTSSTVVTITAGNTLAGFSVFGVDDNVADGDQLVTISATSSVGDDSQVITVLDDGNVGNAAPMIVSLDGPDFANKGSAGDPVTVSGLFSDDDAGDTHTVAIDWGDGTVETLMASEVDQVADSFAADHVYDDGGIYEVTVTVSDGTDATSDQIDAVISGVGLTDDGTLQIVGTNDRDRIFVKPWGDQLLVLTRLGSASWQAHWFDDADVTSIDASLCDGNDVLYISKRVDQNATVDGGDGDDFIRTGKGDDQVVDMSGSNIIQSGGGDDIVTTGTGNDWIDSGSGDDVVAAGDGNDVIYGSSGSDILIGGDGQDRIFGESSGDILIGGETDYDTDVVALGLLSDEWTSENSYEDRIENLRTGAGALDGVRLEVGETVHDDDVRDFLYGACGEDWFLADVDGDLSDNDLLCWLQPNEVVDQV